MCCLNVAFSVPPSKSLEPLPREVQAERHTGGLLQTSEHAAIQIGKL